MTDSRRPAVRTIVALVLGTTRLAVAETGVAAAQTTANTVNSVPEVIVYARKDQETAEISPAARQLVETPGTLGDPLSAVFSLPGVVYAGGDTGTPAVLGSGPADNLFLADSLPVAYVFHTWDVVGASVFSDQIIGTFDLRPVAFGVDYTNVTGAVFDIGLRDPRHQPFSATVDLSLLRSGVFLESALSEHSEAYLSLRQSTIQYFIKPGTTTDGVTLEQPPRDNDYQLKYVWHLGDSQKLSLIANGASDTVQATFLSNSQLVGENPDFAGGARSSTRYNNQGILWDIAPPDAAQLRIALGHSQEVDETSYGNAYFYDETLDRYTGRVLYDQPLATVGTLHLTGELQRNLHGASYDEVLFVCDEFDPTCNDTRRSIVMDHPTLLETSRSLGLSINSQLPDPLRLELGAQYHVNSYTDEHLLEPRGALIWKLTPRTSIALKAGTYDRFPELQTLLPGLGNPRLPASRANHYALSLKNENDTGWIWVVQPYFKQVWRLPLPLGPDEPDAASLYAPDVSGHIYGADFLLQKKADRWYGWLSVSLSRSERTDERTGVTKPYFLDTPLNATAVWNYQWRPNIDIGARLSVRSGQPTTPIMGVVENPDGLGNVEPAYGVPFSTRLPTYKRLDLRVKRDMTVWGFPASVTFDILNVTNSHNVEAYSLDYLHSVPGQRPVIKRFGDLGLLPLVTFRVKF